MCIAVVQVLVGRGCQNIIVSEISTRRQQFALDFGAHHVIDPTKVDTVKEVQRLSKGPGADVAFDAAGVQVGLDTAMKAIRARGTLVNIAIWEKRATLQMNELVFRERIYMGSATYSRKDFNDVIKAISTGQSLMHFVSSIEI
jgi:threonine dehydrogenase-like Zn-dependent dehydrogenase